MPLEPGQAREVVTDPPSRASAVRIDILRLGAPLRRNRWTRRSTSSGCSTGSRCEAPGTTASTGGSIRSKSAGRLQGASRQSRCRRRPRPRRVSSSRRRLRRRRWASLLRWKLDHDVGAVVVTCLIADPDLRVIRSRLRGTNVDPTLGRPPTGRPVELAATQGVGPAGSQVTCPRPTPRSHHAPATATEHRGNLEPLTPQGAATGTEP